MNKFSPVDQEKLAVATSQFVSTGLASANVLVSLKKDHLVKDGAFRPPLPSSCQRARLTSRSLARSTGSAVSFLTLFCKTYIASESVEHLCSSLRKGGVTDLEGFFPPSKQNATELSAHFKAQGLEGVVAFYLKQKSGQAKEDTLARLKEFVAEEADYDEVRFLSPLLLLPLCSAPEAHPPRR
jgi:hypothetical protein